MHCANHTVPGQDKDWPPKELSTCWFKPITVPWTANHCAHHSTCITNGGFSSVSPSSTTLRYSCCSNSGKLSLTSSTRMKALVVVIWKMIKNKVQFKMGYRLWNKTVCRVKRASKIKKMDNQANVPIFWQKKHPRVKAFISQLNPLYIMRINLWCTINQSVNRATFTIVAMRRVKIFRIGC